MLARRLLSVFVAVAWIGEPRPSPATEKPDVNRLDPAARDALSTMLRRILAESIPERVEVKDDWGETRPRFSQLKIHRDGFKLDFETRTKDVKHGLWKQAALVPLEPERNLRFEIVEARSTGPQAFAFQLLVSSPLKATARVERWRTGVKMLNFEAEAAANVEMRLAGSLEYRLTTENDVSYLAIIPSVAGVDLRLIDLDVRRISKADGPLVQELGELFEGPLAKQLDRQEPKVVEKLNAALIKRQGKLRVPLKFPFDLSF